MVGRRRICRLVCGLDRRVDARDVEPAIDADGNKATGCWYVDAHSFSSNGTLRITRGEYRNRYRRTVAGQQISSLTLQCFSQVNVTENGIEDAERLDAGR